MRELIRLKVSFRRVLLLRLRNAGPLLLDLALQQRLQVREEAVSNLEYALLRLREQISPLRIFHQQLYQHIPDFGVLEVIWLPIVRDKLQVAGEVKPQQSLYEFIIGQGFQPFLALRHKGVDYLQDAVPVPFRVQIALKLQHVRVFYQLFEFIVVRVVLQLISNFPDRLVVNFMRRQPQLRRQIQIFALVEEPRGNLLLPLLIHALKHVIPHRVHNIRRPGLQIDQQRVVLARRSDQKIGVFF